MGALAHLEGELEALASAGLLRQGRACVDPRVGDMLDLCSNDYLGYGRAAFEVSAEVASAPSGARGSRLVCGDDAAHEDAERAIASWLGAEAALLFSSGYAANVGAISALARPGDLIASDALNHASIIDGCRLSGATVRVFSHRDTGAAARALSSGSTTGRRWLITESYFSMDGDSPDLASLRRICDQHGAALIVDEAHALGVLGPEGRGLCAEAGMVPDVLVGTAAKALGLQGAFVVGSALLRAWLWNRARSFVFSTGISPVLAAAIARRVPLIRGDDAGRLRLEENANVLREAVRGAGGAATGNVRGPVVPWLVGTAERATAASRELAAQGVFVQAIRPPTVPMGSARLRVTAHARLTREELKRAADAFRRVGG